MHSLGGPIHADHRSPSLDYETVLRVTLALTRNIKDAEKAYTLACFNVLAHNRDDHVKNLSFLLNARSEWIFAPAYDLVFSYGPGGGKACSSCAREEIPAQPNFRHWENSMG
jgi:serine/threonine-protein kinase HipA